MLVHVQLSSLLSFSPGDWSYGSLGIANCEVLSGKQQIWELYDQVNGRLQKENSHT